ncbi:MAG: proline dehydrogenase family protein [Candidatus Kryptoniota bacterium]
MNPLNQVMVSALQLFPKSFIKKFAMRYIAGEDISDSVRVSKELNAKGMMTTVDVLGENVNSKEEALSFRTACEEVLYVINENNLNSNLSIKLTQIGLKLNFDFCYENVRNLLEVAKKLGNFVRIDMEDSSTTSDTLKLYERLRNEGYDNTGVVIQAYLRRSEEDVRWLVELKANVRLCKGIYIEPSTIAYKGKDEIRENYLKLLQMLLDGNCYVGIATHDDYLINNAYSMLKKSGREKERYEFQVLYGVRTALRDRIVSDGHRLRVYVPFGREWYPYSIRRFKENPQFAVNVMKAIISGE